ncbi:MAG: hypothetical protein KGK01_08740 [Bradyrhizobium sp.]|uniref:hypothetical protein n=1 Tax=Bradyrhizobium sp. TaxID=376 RepID=UPI001C292C53|nr:hypothetical protein [Bradyrhizobium sp.]MBU6464189.1 hypothetical protein [Pseudomonadota bacterium]MDE2067901.1 hypothetical protein [Bradyrhizobium sp.]MDE2242512.1 hypothetical protein [Bradyrhizobium sp.]MDE2468598.1 hypothetical protein [Bradyrhizobium sp.]
MKDEKGAPPSNVIELIRKLPAATELTPVMIFQGLELIKVFLTIASVERRKQIVEFAKRIAAEDTDTKA